MKALRTQAQHQLSKRSKEIIKILLYSDIFHYPLTREEIFQRFPFKNTNQQEINLELRFLCQAKLLYQFDGFYTPRNNAQLVERRVEGNQAAKRFIQIGQKISNILGYLPFIKAIFLSGSISKNYADENSDIDYFIITSPQYLWLVRSFLILFKRVFLMNYQKWSCFNYLIASDHLAIETKNIYTAFEIATLVPVYGPQDCQKFLKANTWVKEYFPNIPERNFAPKSTPWLKKWLESGLDISWLRRLDSLLMQKTIEKRKKSFSAQHFNNPACHFNYQKHVAKDHMDGHHQKILSRFQKGIEAFEKRTQFRLD